MIRIDAATVLVQWAAGGWVFLWVTTRRREVGLGYGWLQRMVFLLLAVGSLAASLATAVVWTRDLTTLGFLIVGGVALVVSVARKSAGVAGQRTLVERRSARVAEMTGIDRDEPRFDDSAVEFPPVLDLAAAVFGLAAVLFASIHAGDPVALSIARGLVSALFLGVVSDAMLLGHWYLVQPGLARGPILELVRWTGIVWVPETVLLLWASWDGVGAQRHYRRCLQRFARLVLGSVCGDHDRTGCCDSCSAARTCLFRGHGRHRLDVSGHPHGLRPRSCSPDPARHLIRRLRLRPAKATPSTTLVDVPRAIWSGSISFGLVNIPVRLFTAVRRKTVRFNQIDSASGARVKQKLVSSADGEEVPKERIVKGFALEDGDYVTVSEEEMARARSRYGTHDRHR